MKISIQFKKKKFDISNQISFDLLKNTYLSTSTFKNQFTALLSF